MVLYNEVNNHISYRTYRFDGGISKTVVYNASLHRYIILEGVASDLFAFLGKGDWNNLDYVLKSMDINKDEFLNFYEDLSKQGVFGECYKYYGIVDGVSDTGMFNEEVEIHNICETLAKNGKIFSFHLDITNHCNEKCKHCYHTFDKYGERKELSTKEVFQIIDDVYDLGVFRITLSGGEALLRPDIMDVLEYIHSKHMLLVLFTNGLLLDNNIIDVLAKNGCALVSLSIYGADAITHDSVTGIEGSFDRTIHAVRNLTGHGIFTELKCVVLKDNCNQLKDVKKLAESLECSLKLDFTLTGKVDGDMKPHKHSPDYSDYFRLVKEGLLRLPDCTIGKLSVSPCKAGIYGIYMDAYGDIFPCVSFRIYLGNHKDIAKALGSCALQKWKQVSLKDFYPCGKYDYCNFCLELCAGINMIENGDFLNCETTMCQKAKAMNEYYSNLVEA